jgi:CopG family transcriptional regulator / antitoxin EndoAI
MKKSTRVLISLPDKFLDEIDQIAEEEQRSRSELIREALRIYIRTQDNIQQRIAD